MISWQLIPAMRIGLALATGIACARLPLGDQNLNIALWTTAAIAVILLVWPLPIQTRAKFRGLGVLTSALCIGVLLGITHAPEMPSVEGASAKAFIVQLERQPSKSTNWYSVDGKVTSFQTDSGWTAGNSRVRILLPPPRVTENMQVGATYLVNSRLSEVNRAANPHAFDYSSYLKSQGIVLQAFAPPVQLSGGPELGMILLKEGQAPGGLAAVRSWIAHRIALALPTPSEAAVAKALLLGDKSGLSEDTRKNYTRTGAVHVLAVSGLHTGIIASIILGILGLVSWRKELAWLKLLVFWASLFTYAALTGFSPSVQRSAVMFGILFAGKILRKDANGFNSLGLSAIVLLSFNPQLLFELGFQLSYCAVAGILAFYPTLRKLFAAENYWLNTMGELNAISIAATIGTLPLTTFYFHQFPVYFLLSGIFAVPLVGLALPTLLGGLAVDAVFAFFGSSAYWAYVPAYMFIWLCNACLELIASFPNALVSGLWPSIASTTLAIVSIVLLGAAVLRRRARLYWVALTLGVCWSTSIAYSTFSKLKANQVVVYSLRDELIIDAFDGGLVRTSTQGSSTKISSRAQETIANHRAAMNASIDSSGILLSSPQLSQKHQIQFGMANNFRFAILSSEKQILAPNGPRVDFVIIPEPKAVIAEQLAAAFTTSTYVLQGNIPPWKKDEWKPMDSKIHQLKKQGALIL
ncbi:MAG: ComEC/Rec2 family competence protein [Saprospiraceae bacterium]